MNFGVQVALCFQRQLWRSWQQPVRVIAIGTTGHLAVDSLMTGVPMKLKNRTKVVVSQAA